MRIRYITPARDEFLAALEFYEHEAPGLGRDFDAELRSLESQLADYPESGAPYATGLRRALFPSFPFALI